MIDELLTEAGARQRTNGTTPDLAHFHAMRRRAQHGRLAVVAAVVLLIPLIVVFIEARRPDTSSTLRSAGTARPSAAVSTSSVESSALPSSSVVTSTTGPSTSEVRVTPPANFVPAPPSFALASGPIGDGMWTLEGSGDQLMLSVRDDSPTSEGGVMEGVPGSRAWTPAGLDVIAGWDAPGVRRWTGTDAIVMPSQQVADDGTEFWLVRVDAPDLVVAAVDAPGVAIGGEGEDAVLCVRDSCFHLFGLDWMVVPTDEGAVGVVRDGVGGDIRGRVLSDDEAVLVSGTWRVFEWDLLAGAEVLSTAGLPVTVIMPRG